MRKRVYDYSLFSRSGTGCNSKRQGGLIEKINLQFYAQMPSKEAQIKHIMSERKGHIIDTPENRSLLESGSSNEKNYVGKDSHGNTRYAKLLIESKFGLLLEMESFKMVELMKNHLKNFMIKKRI